MATGHYQGPIIDAHHHFWDLRLGRHPWLQGNGAEAPLRRNHLPADYLAELGPVPVVASVHVEANWDPTDPEGEIAWLDGLERPNGIAERYVAYAALGADSAPALIERYAAHPRIAGIREILSWHPLPEKRRIADGRRMEDPQWRETLGRLARHRLSFELLLSPHQLQQARRLADDFPDLTFVLNHCGSPMDRDPEGMQRWRAGLQALAGAGNVVIKISDPVAYDPHWTEASLTDVIRTCLECFGPERALFASDYPVANLHIGFAEWLAICRRVLQPYPEVDQYAVFAGNSARVYGISEALVRPATPVTR